MKTMLIGRLLVQVQEIKARRARRALLLKLATQLRDAGSAPSGGGVV